MISFITTNHGDHWISIIWDLPILYCRKISKTQLVSTKSIYWILTHLTLCIVIDSWGIENVLSLALIYIRVPDTNINTVVQACQLGRVASSRAVRGCLILGNVLLDICIYSLDFWVGSHSRVGDRWVLCVSKRCTRRIKHLTAIICYEPFELILPSILNILMKLNATIRALIPRRRRIRNLNLL